MEDVILRFGTFEGETLPVPFPCGKDAKVERPPREKLGFVVLRSSVMVTSASRRPVEGIKVSRPRKLKKAWAEIDCPADPWLAPLQRVRSKVEFDRQERVTSQTLLDMLEVPQRSRTAGTFRRLGEVDGGVGLDGGAGSRSHARRLQGAGARLLQDP